MGYDDERSCAYYFIAPYRGDIIRGCWVLQRTVFVPARLGDVVQEVPALFDGRWSAQNVATVENGLERGSGEPLR